MNVEQIRGPLATTLVAILVGAWFGYLIASGYCHRNAVEQSCAFYDGKTGEFKWGQPQ